MHQIGNHQPDDIRLPCHKTARNPIRLVLQLFGAPQDPLPRRLTDIGVPPQRFGDRHERDAQVFRDVLHTKSQITPSLVKEYPAYAVDESAVKELYRYK